ncbi:MAG: biotin--[acetyl-CoA-carboxylase] ligase [Candidatus Methanomethyliaceae archaeon]|nr:biotin--[acetyl-CoA-carboxylase] ligase [Candidatus Methanomethyliaceae archaeon]
MVGLSSKIDDLLIKGSFVSGQGAASAFGVSRTAVFKRIQQLRKLGYDIEAVRKKGYRLVPRFDGLLPLEIKSRLKTRIFGKEIITLDSVDSTQTYMGKLAEKGAPEGTVVLALEQTRGKGRMNRVWSSPRGGLWFSLLLRPSIPPKELHKLTLLFGVAIVTALQPLGINASLKWPNDVLIDRRKVCGILLEASTEIDRVDYVIAGIGINVNTSLTDLPSEICDSAVSLCDIIGTKIDRAELLCGILKNSEDLYLEASENGFSRVISLWRSNSCTIGQRVEVRMPDGALRGLAVDIDEDGSLLVKYDNGFKKIYSGDIILL